MDALFSRELLSYKDRRASLHLAHKASAGVRHCNGQHHHPFGDGETAVFTSRLVSCPGLLPSAVHAIPQYLPHDPSRVQVSCHPVSRVTMSREGFLARFDTCPKSCMYL